MTRGAPALWLAAALLAAACNHDAVLPGRAPERLVMLLDEPPKTLDPRFATDAISMRLSKLVFAALVTVDNPAITPRPELAESWVFDAGDPRKLTVRLREGLTWHDGVPLTSADVVYTYASVMDPALGSPLRDPYAAQLEHVEAVDPLTVRFTLRQTSATVLTDLVLGLVPQHVVEPAGGRFPDGKWTGSGEWKLLGLTGKRIDLEALPGWLPEAAVAPTPALPPPLAALEKAKAGERPRYLSFVVIKDEGTRLLALLGGSADLVQGGISPVIAASLERDARVHVAWAKSISFTYLALNLRKEGLADRRVRQALAYAIPREKLVEAHLAGHATLATGMLSPLHWAYCGAVPTYGYDPDRARTLLAEAGFGPDRPLQLVIKVSNHRLRRAISRLIAESFRQVGVDADVRSFEFSTFFSDIRAGNFDAYLLDLPEPMEPDLYRWFLHSLGTPEKAPAATGSAYATADRRYLPPGALDDHVAADPTCARWPHEALRQATQNVVLQAFGEPAPYSAANRMYYSNPLVDCRLELGRRTLDPKRRRELYDQVQLTLATDLPVIPLWHADTPVISRPRVHGYVALPNQRFANVRAATVE